MHSQIRVPGAASYARAAAPTLLGLASVVVIAIGEASRRKLGTPQVGDALQSFQSWLFLTATSLGLGSHYVESRRVHGALTLAMALVFVSAASAGLLQIAFGPPDASVLSACVALLSFVLAAVALQFAVLTLAPHAAVHAVVLHRHSTRSDASQRSARAGDVLRLWRQRTRSRKQLGDLTEDQLRDIGLSRADAFVEANKPFWRA